MITLILFLTGVVSLLCFSPDLTAFYYYNPVNLQWFVRIISHMVSHGNWYHLLGNFLFGLPFMLYVEHRLNDHKKFLKLFFFTGLMALLGQGIAERFMPIQVGGVIGSSGAIFGIVAFALAIANETKWVRLLAWGTLVFHVYNQGMLTWLSIKGLTFGVAFAAHFVGILTGVAMAINFLRHRPKNRRPSRSRKSRP